MTQDNSNTPRFESRLPDGTDRFISHLIEHALSIGRRTSRDFLRHFPPAAIMEALKDSPSLRADILETSTGVRRKVALKKSATSSGDDLQIALDEGEAAPDEVVRLFRPDDRVRFLARQKLWSFLIEGEFWNTGKSSDKAGYERAQQHIAFLLDRALKDQLLTHQDVVDGISVNKLSQLMPRPELETALTSALAAGRKGQAFSDRDLYDSLTSNGITTHIPLPHIWDEVVHPCIAVEHGLGGTRDAPAKTEEAANGAEAAKAAPANSNDQGAAQPVRLPTSKVVVPSSAIRRPRPNDSAAPGAATPGTGMPGAGMPGAKPVTGSVKLPNLSSDAAPPSEEVPCDLDFDDTLTASKG